MAAETVPIASRGMSFPCSLFKSQCASAVSRFLMSFLKKNKTTIRVPMCKINSKSSKSSMVKNFRKCSAIFKCPVLEIGSHSVKPCIVPSRIIFQSCSKRVSSFLVVKA